MESLLLWYLSLLFWIYRTRAIITRGSYTFYPLFEVHEDIMTKFKSQGLHNIRIKYWNVSRSGPTPSFIPTHWNIGTIHLRRRHVLGGEGGSPLPMFADARGVGVLGLPTSAIFESIRRYFCKKKYEKPMEKQPIDYIIRINDGKFDYTLPH